jgi:hypothetical protein
MAGKANRGDFTVCSICAKERGVTACFSFAARERRREIREVRRERGVEREGLEGRGEGGRLERERRGRLFFGIISYMSLQNVRF